MDTIMLTKKEERKRKKAERKEARLLKKEEKKQAKIEKKQGALGPTTLTSITPNEVAAGKARLEEFQSRPGQVVKNLVKESAPAIALTGKDEATRQQALADTLPLAIPGTLAFEVINKAAKGLFGGVRAIKEGTLYTKPSEEPLKPIEGEATIQAPGKTANKFGLFARGFMQGLAGESPYTEDEGVNLVLDTAIPLMTFGAAPALKNLVKFKNVNITGPEIKEALSQITSGVERGAKKEAVEYAGELLKLNEKGKTINQAIKEGATVQAKRDYLGWVKDIFKLNPEPQTPRVAAFLDEVSKVDTAFIPDEAVDDLYQRSLTVTKQADDVVEAAPKALGVADDVVPGSTQLPAQADQVVEPTDMIPTKEYPLADRGEWYGEANFESSGGKLVEMTPEEFLDKAAPLEVDDIARDNIDDLKAHIESGKTLDPLTIYDLDKSVTSNSDGRHRAIAAMELGIKKVPVIDYAKPPQAPAISPKGKIPEKVFNSEKGVETFGEMQVAEKGSRIATEEGTIGVSSSFPEWVPSELRSRKLFDKVQDHLLNGTVPTTKRASELYQIVHERMLGGAAPVPTGTSRVGQSMAEKAVEEKLTTAFGGTAEYDKITIADQAKRATDLVDTDIDKALRVLDEEESLPDGLRGASIITALEDYAMKTKDGELLQRIARSPLTSETSIHAQEMRLLAERAPDSPIGAMQKIRKARITKAERNLKRGETIAKEKTKIVRELKEEIKKVAPTKETWESFVDSITC